MAAWRSG